MKKLLILALLPFASYAGDPHGSSQTTTIITNTYTYPRTIKSYTGVALGLAAAQHSFSITTPALQWSISAATYEDSDAASFAIAKKLTGESIMVNFSYGLEDGHEGFGVGINGVF